MNVNEQAITAFYSAFQNRDYQTMQNCYAEKVIFFERFGKNGVRISITEAFLIMKKDCQVMSAMPTSGFWA